MSGLERRRVRITGIVQGVGYRPFVWRLATRLGLGGHVENGPAGVTAEIEGSAEAVAAFLARLATEAPPLAAVDRVAVEMLPPPVAAPTGPFLILDSDRAGGSRPALVPPDVAPCDACLREMTDQTDRRFGHPFISCTDCGPRYTIIESLPYDRGATTMRTFAMCSACAAEYHDPASRRFHSQTIACPCCGPSVWFATTGGAVPEQAGTATILAWAAIDAARDAIRSGGIVAVKGVGGFHLACDATNAAAVQRLRDRKRRGRKPLAVMVADIEAARAIAEFGEQERRLLERAERPIVLVRRRLGEPTVAGAVAPGSEILGVMLPSSPLHHMLCAGLPPLAMTSGNLSEEPIAIGTGEAIRRLTVLVDAFLMHDRDIHVACDDSVVRCVVGVPQPVRRSRGHCPLPIRLADDGPPVLAVGGELKAALCVTRGTEAVMSQHVGDVENLETLEALDRTATRLIDLLAVSPAAVVADLHPGHLSTRWAREFAAARGLPLVRVQHHEAHVAALLTEHGIALSAADGTIGVCFDGTGYGRDGTIQGGEMLVSREGVLVRAAHLVPFLLPGGDAAIRHPWRTALAVLQTAGIEPRSDLPCIAAAPPPERAVVVHQLAGGFGCVTTTSMGRLFDAIASLLGLRHSIAYEAEAAIDLESAAAAAGSRRHYAGQAVKTADGSVALDWRPIVRGVVADVAAAVPAALIALGFHVAIAQLTVAACRLLRERGSFGTVGLTGGVFQNAILAERTALLLRDEGFDVLVHRTVPANDGGLALGQAAIARREVSCQ
ncbi:MAG: carbamoyltransferase HypF [Planctomycetaceae bacterium]